MKTRKRLRSIQQLMDDMLWPRNDLHPETVRGRALTEVLTTIPDEDYGSLSARIDTFHWFAPDPDLEAHARLYTFPVTMESRSIPEEFQVKPGGDRFTQTKAVAHVVYISPLLENYSVDEAVDEIAHTLAFVLVGAWPIGSMVLGSEDYTRREQRATEIVRAWGFTPLARWTIEEG